MIWNILSSNSFLSGIFGADLVDLKPHISLFPWVIFGLRKRARHVIDRTNLSALLIN